MVRHDGGWCASDGGGEIRRDGLEYRVAFQLGADTGLRRGEGAALRWADVHPTGECDEPGCWLGGDGSTPPSAHVHVTATLQRVNGALQRMQPKSGNGYRAVPLAPALVAALRQHRKDQTERRMLVGPDWQDQDVVVDRGDGGVVDPDALSKAFHAAAVAAGHPTVRLHDLRHGFGTSLAPRVDPKTLSKMMGHATTGFTMSVYVSPDVAMGAKATEAVRDARGG